jgi:DNA-binding ferritin-like protein
MTLAEKIRDNKAVYTGAGAVDFAVEKLREMPETVAKVRAELTENYGKYRVAVLENVNDVRGEVNERVTKVRTTATLRLNEVRANVAKAQGKTEAVSLQDYLATVTAKVSEVIDELAERGRTVINKAADDITSEAQQAKSVEAPAKPKTASTARRSTAKKTAD